MLEETSIEGARGLLINITGGEGVTLNEINEAAEIITEGVDPQAQILFGAVINPAMGDALQVTVIATGFGSPQQATRLPAQEAGPAPREAIPTREKRIWLPGGPGTEYGINQTDDYEIPAILRRQMD